MPQARKLCPGAIVGKGFGHAVVKFPEQAPIPVSSPITIFNGPRIKGDPSVFAHFYTTVPVAVAFVVPIRIETIRNGRYGYRVNAEIPKIANGAGIPISGSITDRPQMDLQRRQAQLHQRPLPRRPPPGDGQVRLQRRHPPAGDVPQPLSDEGLS